MKIIRVFPLRTNATPDDELARVGLPEFWDEADEVHISVAFTYDLPMVEQLEREWKYVAPVKVGGPATGMRGEEFVTGMYLKHGYTITSRGCPNRCWFCKVWQREGGVRELPIRDGWWVQDDNILACSEAHIRAVFAMLKRQPHRAEFKGGLEAKRLMPWHVDLLRDLNPLQMFYAYDTPDDYEPLVRAAGMLKEAGFTRDQMRCFVLCGYPKDTIAEAERRMWQVMDLGMFPQSMLYRDEKGEQPVEWARFHREWARPAIMRSKLKRSAEAEPEPRAQLKATGE